MIFSIEQGNLQEIGGKLQDLQNRLQSLRQSALALEGSEWSESEQIRRIQGLREEILLKNQLIAKYRRLGLTVLENGEGK